MLGLNQQIMYFFIADLGEIFVTEAHTVEWLRRLCTYDFVYLCLELATGRGSRYRYRYHNTSGMLLSQGHDRRAHRGTRCQPIVNQYNCAALYIGWGKIIAVEMFAPLQFLLLSCCHRVNYGIGNVQHAYHILVNYTYTSRRNSPHLQFLQHGNPDLRHARNIQCRIQSLPSLK